MRILAISLAVYFAALRFCVACGKGIFVLDKEERRTSKDATREHKLKSFPGVTSHVFGGQPAKIDKYPWLVALTFQSDTNDVQCAGVLIAPTVVLTSALCLFPGAALVGCNNFLNGEQNEANCERILISRRNGIVHPLFNFYFVPKNDFRLFILDRPSKNPPVTYFARSSYYSKLPEGVQLTTMGWGAIGSSTAFTFPVVAYEVVLNYVSNPNCAAIYDTIQSGLIDDSEVCVFALNKGPTSGDQGDPLVQECKTGTNLGEVVFLGTASWSASVEYEVYPAVYSRAAAVEDFIAQVVQDEGYELNFVSDYDNFCTVDGTHAPTSPPNMTPPPTAPLGWTCSPEYYGNYDGCDCECGLYDPDCDVPGMFTLCPSGQICSKEAECVPDPNPTPAPTREQEPPPEWSCIPALYAAGDGRCDCLCNAYDPDCDDPEAAVLGCKHGQTCSNETFTCEGEDDIPASWTCRYWHYGWADGCDCDCGAHDPDCDLEFQPVANCPFAHMICVDDVCIDPLTGTTAAPIGGEPENTAKPTPKPITQPTAQPTSDSGEEPDCECPSDGNSHYPYLIAVIALLGAVLLALTVIFILLLLLLCGRQKTAATDKIFNVKDL